MAAKRNYKQEAKYHAQPEQKKRRAARNASRRKMLAAGKAKKGQDVHHKDGNPFNMSFKNLQATSKKYNRSRNK